MRDRVFYSVCFGFIFGVLLRSFVFVDIFTIGFLVLIALAFLIARNKWAVVASVFIISISLGILRFDAADKPVPQIDSGAKLLGVIVDEPDIRENNQKLTVKLEDAETKVLVTTNLGGYYKYGDEVEVRGNLERPENFITDQGKEFDYINYLRKDGIFYLMSFGEVEIISRGHGSILKRTLFSIKEKFLEKMNFAIASPENQLMGGLILGEKSSFSPELRQQFVDTGTIHIVALSGYNVTIVAEWFMKLFSAFPKNLGIWMGIFAVFLFVLMSGASSTAVRAGIMATLALVARATGKNYDAARALILAGVIMVLVNPFILAFDVSFQLSFIATVAVILFAPKIEKYFLWIKWKPLQDVVHVTVAAYIFVLPFILYKMGNLSLVALPANVLVLPFIPLTMLLGFVTGLLGVVFHLLAVPTGFITYLFLHYELGVINLLSKVPFAAVSIPYFPLVVTLLIYAYFIYRLFGKDIKNFFLDRP